MQQVASLCSLGTSPSVGEWRAVTLFLTETGPTAHSPGTTRRITQAGVPTFLLIVGAALVDGTGSAPRRGGALLAEDGRIKQVGPSDVVRQQSNGAERVDVRDASKLAFWPVRG
jgi:hypothetical protein